MHAIFSKYHLFTFRCNQSWYSPLSVELILSMVLVIVLPIQCVCFDSWPAKMVPRSHHVLRRYVNFKALYWVKALRVLFILYSSGSLCGPLSYKFSCSQFRQCTGWSAWSCSHGWLLCTHFFFFSNKMERSVALALYVTTKWSSLSNPHSLYSLSLFSVSPFLCVYVVSLYLTVSLFLSVCLSLIFICLSAAGACV